MKKAFFGLVLLFSVLIYSCSTDFDILDEYKETTVVYGLLDQSDTAQYIKINKAFLGEGNALIMAQEFDSITYDTTKIKVTLSSPAGVILLYPDTSIQKETGVFYAPHQVLYKTKAALSSSNSYTLKVENKVTGNIVTSTTPLVKDFEIIFPSSTSAFNFTNPNAPVRVKWRSAVNGRLYELIIRFHYNEKNKTTGEIVPKSIDWVFGSLKSTTLNGNEDMEVNFMGEAFYRFLSGRSDVLAVNNAVNRHVGKIDVFFAVASENYNTYMEVNKPSLGIVREKPEFSNIDGGIGLFASRYNKSRVNLNMTAASMDSLCAGQFTKQLGFCDPSKIAGPCQCK